MSYDEETDSLVREFKKAVDRRQGQAMQVIEALRRQSAVPTSLPVAPPKGARSRRVTGRKTKAGRGRERPAP